MAVATQQRMTLADVLLKEGLINEDQHSKAVSEHERSSRSMVRILTDMGAVSEQTRVDLLRKRYNVKVVKLGDVTPSAEVAGVMSKEACRKSHVVPLRIEDGSVVVAMEDPTDVRVISDIERAFGRSVRPLLAATREIQETIDKLADGADDSGPKYAKPGLLHKLLSTASVLSITFAPLILFYYVIQNTPVGRDWFASLSLNHFERGLTFVVVWGSWASVAYFVNDLIFGKSAEQ